MSNLLTVPTNVGNLEMTLASALNPASGLLVTEIFPTNAEQAQTLASRVIPPWELIENFDTRLAKVDSDAIAIQSQNVTTAGNIGNLQKRFN